MRWRSADGDRLNVYTIKAGKLCALLGAIDPDQDVTIGPEPGLIRVGSLHDAYLGLPGRVPPAPAVIDLDSETLLRAVAVKDAGD